MKRCCSKISNRFVWFYKWVIERQTFKTISRDNSKVNLRIDGTYFNKFCLVCYQGNNNGYTQLIRFSDGEHYDEIKEGLNNLMSLRVDLESITVDGHKSVLKAIKKALPQIIVQRCVVHIQKCAYCG